MAKYKLKEGKSLDNFPNNGKIGRTIRIALTNNGSYEDFPGAQEIPSDCLSFLTEETGVSKVATPKNKEKSKGGK
tara:strand:+ start:2168 stop:2392 length:225 start_codon:yes stop_codon:yes gene_type:complete